MHENVLRLFFQDQLGQSKQNEMCVWVVVVVVVRLIQSVEKDFRPWESLVE